MTVFLRKICLQLLLLSFLLGNSLAVVHAVDHYGKLAAAQHSQVLGAADVDGLDDGLDCGLCQLAFSAFLGDVDSACSLCLSATVDNSQALPSAVQHVHRLRPPSRAPPSQH